MGQISSQVGLYVDTEKLGNLSNKLVKTEFDEQLNSLNEAMDSIKEKGTWLDAQGSTFTTTFSNFIDDALKITDGITVLGKEAGECVTAYEEAVDTACKEMANK